MAKQLMGRLIVFLIVWIAVVCLCLHHNLGAISRSSVIKKKITQPNVISDGVLSTVKSIQEKNMYKSNSSANQHYDKFERFHIDIAKLKSSYKNATTVRNTMSTAKPHSNITRINIGPSFRSTLGTVYMINDVRKSERSKTAPDINKQIPGYKPGTQDPHSSNSYEDVNNRIFSTFSHKVYRPSESSEETVPRWFLPPSDDLANNSSRYLIYRCEATDVCGGWADRVKGMITGFVLASLTNRVFKIDLPMTDCHLTNYLLPNVYNWSSPISNHGHIGPIQPTSVRNLYFGSDRNFYKNVHKWNFTESFGSYRYIYFRANLDYIDGLKKNGMYVEKLSWMKNLTRDNINARLFKSIFKLSDSMKSKLDDFLSKSRDRKLICTHVRMGRNPSFPTDTVIRQNLEDLPIVWRFIQAQINLTSNQLTEKGTQVNTSSQQIQQKPTDQDYNIFFMSDSEQAVELTSHQIFNKSLIFSPGPVIHVDRDTKSTAEQKCLGFEKVLFDQQVLTHCDVLMVSNSGLSRMSAYLRQTDSGLFCLVRSGNTTSVVKCFMRTIKELYGVMG